VATAPARRPGRPRPGEPALTRDAILAAALALVDEQGIEALSMRKLAARLQVDPMSIYHHVPNKAALVSGLVRAVFAEMAPPPAADGPWDQRVRAWARAYRDLALAHPHLVLQIVTDAAAASEAAIQISEPLYAAFASAGLAPREILHAAGTLVDFVNGYALGASAAATASRSDHLAAMDPGAVPTMHQIHEAVAADKPGGGFEAGLDIIVRGIAPGPAGSGPRSAATSPDGAGLTERPPSEATTTGPAPGPAGSGPRSAATSPDDAGLTERPASEATTTDSAPGPARPDGAGLPGPATNSAP
jgi:TetR/AcrR family tetracycline transcriptional repressor